MPIRIQLDRVLLQRRMSLTELADRVGVTLANLSILKTGKARAIRFSTLDALCRELDCQPGDILVFEPGPPDDGRGVTRTTGTARVHARIFSTTENTKSTNAASGAARTFDCPLTSQTTQTSRTARAEC